MANLLSKVTCGLLLLLVLSPVVRTQTPLTSNRRFSNLLFNEVVISQPGKSVILSPTSVALSLAVLLQGAEGETLTEMLDTIYTSDKDDTKAVYGDEMATLKAWTSVAINVANKVYVMDGYTINADFEANAVDYFYSAIQAIDFSNNNAAAGTINSWVEVETKNTIKNLVKPNMLSGDTRLVLVNAIYFKGDWEKKFKASNTKKQKFFPLNKKSVLRDMMNQNGKFLYGELPKLNSKVVELFYKGKDFSLVIVLPNKTHGLTALESSIQSSTDWRKLLRVLKPTNIKLSIPKFKTETDIDLKKILPNLGTQLIFDASKAELTGLLDNYVDTLYVTDFIQKAFIDVNEEGTTAAAATAVIVAEYTAAPAPPATISFIADHAFLYFIRDVDGHILFMGSYKG